jgi:hypothetical protein
MSVNQLKQSRDEYKKIKQDEKKKVVVEKEKVEERPEIEKPIRVRLIPIWLRIVLMAVMIVVCVVAGAAVGYGVLGDGKAFDVLKESTWTHILNLVEKK